MILKSNICTLIKALIDKSNKELTLLKGKKNPLVDMQKTSYGHFRLILIHQTQTHAYTIDNKIKLKTMVEAIFKNFKTEALWALELLKTQVNDNKIKLKLKLGQYNPLNYHLINK